MVMSSSLGRSRYKEQFVCLYRWVSLTLRTELWEAEKLFTYYTTSQVLQTLTPFIQETDLPHEGLRPNRLNKYSKWLGQCVIFYDAENRKSEEYQPQGD